MEERIKKLEEKVQKLENNILELIKAQNNMVALFNGFVDKSADNFRKIQKVFDRSRKNNYEYKNNFRIA